MNKLLPATALFLALLLTGCAAWSPTFADATSAARETACVICQMTGGLSEQAAKHAEALRKLAEMLGSLIDDKDAAKLILMRLEAMQGREAELFRELLEKAAK